MSSREVVGMFVVLQECGFKMCQGILFTEEPPYTFAEIGTTAIKLRSFQLLKLMDKNLIDDQSLIAVHPRSLVRMFSNTLLQKLRHLEIGIAE